MKSVLLLSTCPVEEIDTVYLDTDSRTSVALARVLASQHWKISPSWKSISELKGDIIKHEAKVLIGDKTFGLHSKYSFCYDLAKEWIAFSGLPFVFAAWVSTNPIPLAFEQALQAALAWGVEHLEDSVQVAHNPHITADELVSYLKNDISYTLDDNKRKGMEMFLKLIS